MAVVPKCCACASHGPTSQLPKPHDQLFSTISLYGNTKSRTTALLLPEESKKLHLGSVKESSCSSTDAIKSKVASELERIREVIEKETGQPVSYADWAKAAKTDTGTLSQLLIHGQYCRDQLVQCTQPLVIFLVKKYRGLGIGPDDLVQAGNLGVLKGAEKFDSKKGYRFSTYIRHWIRKAIFEFIAQNSRIFRLSVRAECMVQKIEKAQRELHFNLGRYPSDEETAKFTGFTLAKVRLARRCSRSIRSLERPFKHGSSISLKDIIPDKSLEGRSSINRKILNEELLFILEELNPREKQIIAQRYGLSDGTCRSLEEIGQHFNLSKEWIRKLEKRAIAKLRRDDIKDNVRRLLHWYN
ncbi:RNApolymerase sigma-subunit C isoform X3 [Carex rostrata]